jgi:2-dehydro-3-deoxyphosphogluconate aldolase/(4S)-4-hydroxy-2-oxoglutarate aldolase
MNGSPGDVVGRISRAGILPVVVIEDPDVAPALATALQGGGLDCAEVTMRTDQALRALAVMAADPGLVVGAGTVLTPAQVDNAIAAGAQFIVCPGVSIPVIRRCRDLGVPVIPGVATATEVMTALDEGVTTLKFFPALTCGGPAAVAALAAPFRGVGFLPTGGITPTTAADYLRLPAVVAVGGTWITAEQLLALRRFDEIERLARDATALVGPARRTSSLG